ncbi:phage protein NinX family protein [Variovorax sp. JS1663]|uniref:phage protein NinX family protein n=1 Tax=Variovorax sp. JS1663 TaxID=1851577 RepID=UPI000B3439FF|nr:phage protein NinX family protein [Variovorax sp. JS1663]OUM00569.1 hypothetical protein A8M77_21115 [Variovorax sp. JS1663]
MHVYQLDGHDLDYWVARAIDVRVVPMGEAWALEAAPAAPWEPHKDWALGGPILHENMVSIIYIKNGSGCKGECHRYRRNERPPHSVGRQWGDDPLQAGLRALVEAACGEEVDPPLQHYREFM